MQEIEIKFKVDDLEKIKSNLLNLNCIFSKEKNQKDSVFVPDLNDTSNREGKMFIRVRSVNGKVEMNLKKQSDKIMQSKEIEFEASDFDRAYDFLKTLGLKEWVTVEKKRITTKYNKYNICIDEVKRLGSFVEIEIVTDEENKTEEFEKEILDIAMTIGIDINNRVNNFYDTMIHELDNK